MASFNRPERGYAGAVIADDAHADISSRYAGPALIGVDHNWITRNADLRNMFQAKWKAIARKIDAIGVSGTLALIIQHIVTGLFHRNYLLFYVDLPTYTVHPQQMSTHVVGRHIKSFDDLSSADITDIRNYAGENYLREVQNRLANGWTLFLAYVESSVAGGGWALGKSSQFSAKVVPICWTDVVLLDYFTFPSFRGRNVYPFLLSFILNHFRENNILRAFIYVSERNAASIKGIQKAGFQHIISYEGYRLGRNELIIWKGSLKKSGSH